MVESEGKLWIQKLKIIIIIVALLIKRIFNENTLQKKESTRIIYWGNVIKKCN